MFFYEVFCKYIIGLKFVCCLLILKVNIKDSLYYFKEIVFNSDWYWLFYGLFLS